MIRAPWYHRVMTNRIARKRPATCAAIALAFAAVTASGLSLGGPSQRAGVRADEQQEFPPAMPAAGRIVYTRQALDEFDMFTSDPDGSNETRLSDINESAAGEDQPRWSPDGQRIAFSTFRDGAATLHILDAHGGVPRTVVVRDGMSGDAAWSPDGRCLVYNGGRADDEMRFDLKVWCDDGSPDGSRRTLTDTPEIDERDPDWSPDGTRIAFVALPHAPAPADRWTLHSVRSDGTDRRQVLALSDEHIRFPRHDPSGERIGFIGNRQNLPFGALSTFDPLTGRRERLCELASDAWTWSPDGSEILFANIANAGVRLLEASFSHNLSLTASLAPPMEQRPAASSPHARTASQYKGLYRIDVASRTVGRLTGAAGGAEAPNSATNFEFGFMPDWTAGTATPTDGPTASATTEPTPTLPDPATPTPSPTQPPPTVTAAPTPSATARGAGRIYLPRMFRAVLPNRRR
jgi:hypothetical protein